MKTLRRLLWIFAFCSALTESEAGAMGCTTDPWGRYQCPDGYYWYGGGDWGWADYHDWRHYHGWGYHSPYWDWYDDWHWAYYRPSLYRDYYTYAVIDGVAIRRPIVSSGASAKPKPAEDTACDKAQSSLKIIGEKLRLNPDSVALKVAADDAQQEVMNSCLPPWMRRAAGLGEEKKPTPDSAAAL